MKTPFQRDRKPLSLADILGADGILAKKLPGYECRPAQLQAAHAVADILEGGCLVIEAPTGTGKTLAYLLPSLLSGQRVVISTGTLNLQDQILEKEVPFLKKHVFPDLSAMCVKGRQNYLCLYRWHQFLAEREPSLFGEEEKRTIELSRWAGSTETGDRAEIPWLGDESPLWQELCSSTIKCLGAQCPESSSCFITRLRRACGQAQLLIVNHHLFFSDLALRQTGYAEILPRYESVVFDEAHHLEDVITKHFGLAFTHYQVLDLVRDVEKSARNLAGKNLMEKTVQLARTLAREAAIFSSLFPADRGRFSLHDFLDGAKGLEKETDDLVHSFDGLARHLDGLSATSENWESLLRRSRDLAGTFLAIMKERDSDFVYWFERREKTIQLTASPIDIRDTLRRLVDQTESLVFTSATLTTGNDFSYFLDRMGLSGDTQVLSCQMVYDYGKSTLLYVPENDFPPPSHANYSQAVMERIAALVHIAGGRTLVLFTSVTAMRNCHAYLLEQSIPYPILVQGEAPKRVLLERFRNTVHSVLLAVASFWEGVDIPGESLSSVIIDKLPFEVPSDPVIMARMKRIEESGGHPFIDFQVPRAVLALRQGVGRLLRSSTDRGVLSILDVRLFTKPYGRLFLKSLPPSPITRKLNDVEAFFSQEESVVG